MCSLYWCKKYALFLPLLWYACMVINHIIKPQVNICLHHTSQDKYNVACTWNSVNPFRTQDWRKTRRLKSQTNDDQVFKHLLLDTQERFAQKLLKISIKKKRWTCWIESFGTYIKTRGTFTRFNVKRPEMIKIIVDVKNSRKRRR